MQESSEVETTALVTTTNDSPAWLLNMNSGQMNNLERMATFVAKSTFGGAINSMDKAITIMMQGMELGLQPMAAIRNIHIIDSKPTLSADLMSALVIKHGHPRIQVTSLSDQSCTVRGRRREETEWQEFTFTWQDAIKAGLTGKTNWSKHPKSMLRVRAISGICYIVFPDIFAGVYVPEEMDAVIAEGSEVQVIDAHSGETVMVIDQPVTKTPPVAKQILERYEASQQAPATKTKKPLTQTQFESYLKEMKVTPEQIAYRLSAGLMSTVREWLLAHPAPDKDHFRHVLREYVTECNESDDKAGQAFNWVWDARSDLPVETQDIPFAEQPVTHADPAATAEVATELKALVKELGGSVVTATTATEVIEDTQPLTGEEFADWIGVISGHDPRTDEKLKAQLLGQVHHKTVSDWWKASRKENAKDPYRLMLKEAVSILKVAGWVWNETTGMPEPKAKPDPWESGAADEVGTEDVPVF